MIHANFTEFRKRLAHYLDRANQDRDAILVTRQGSDPVVVLAQSDYEGMVETLHLLSSPANARVMEKGLSEAERGERIEVVWDEATQRYVPK
jgi:antitoxin YefM